MKLRTALQILIIIVLLLSIIALFISLAPKRYENPVEEMRLRVEEICHPKIAMAKNTTTAPKKSTKWSGVASYYSWEGCLGCNPKRIMANGEQLNDNRLTLAFNHLPLNKTVKVCNTKNRKCVNAKITDRGGFNSLGRKMSKVGNNGLNRIADLSVATRDSISCSHLCKIEIEY